MSPGLDASDGKEFRIGSSDLIADVEFKKTGCDFTEVCFGA